MRIAVLGSSGFIGSAVTTELLSRGHDVVHVTAPRVRSAARNSGAVIDEAGDATIGNLTSQLANCAAVVNCTGVASPGAGLSDELVGANSLLPGLIGRAASQAGVRRYVHVSSAAVYGRARELNVAVAPKPESPYGKSKLWGEAAALELGPCETIVYRATSVHGPDREVTRTLQRLAKSPFSSVAGEGNIPTPQVTVEEVANYIADLSDSEPCPAPIVLQPLTGRTTASFLRELSEGREPRHVPLWLARMTIAAARLTGRVSPATDVHARRLEMLWFGQSVIHLPELKCEGTGPPRVGLLASTAKHLESFFTEIAEELEAGGCVTILGSGDTGTLGIVQQIPGITQRPDWRNWRSIKGTRDWVTENNIDIVVANTAMGAGLARIAKLPVPVIYFCHGFHWNTGKTLVERIWQAAELMLASRTAALIVINSDDEAWARRAVRDIPIYRFAGGVGVPTSYFAPMVSRQSVDFSLVWIGDFSDRKRPQLAVTVAAELRDRGIKFELVMYGDGPLLPEIRALIVASGLSSLVKTPGRTNCVLEALDRSSILIHTARWEGLPRVLLEATTRGCAIVAFDVKGVRDVPSAHLVPDGDCAGMAERVIASVGTTTETCGTVWSSRRAGRELRRVIDAQFRNTHGCVFTGAESC